MRELNPYDFRHSLQSVERNTHMTLLVVGTGECDGVTTVPEPAEVHHERVEPQRFQTHGPGINEPSLEFMRFIVRGRDIF